MPVGNSGAGEPGAFAGDDAAGRPVPAGLDAAERRYGKPFDAAELASLGKAETPDSALALALAAFASSAPARIVVDMALGEGTRALLTVGARTLSRVYSWDADPRFGELVRAHGVTKRWRLSVAPIVDFLTALPPRIDLAVIRRLDSARLTVAALRRVAASLAPAGCILLIDRPGAADPGAMAELGGACASMKAVVVRLPLPHGALFIQPDGSPVDPAMVEEAFWRDLVAHDPALTAAARAHAKTSLGAGRVGEAVAILRGAADGGGSFELRRDLAILLAERGRYADARGALAALAAEDIPDESAARKLATLAKNLGDRDLEQRLVERACALAPSAIAPLVALSDHFLRTARPDEGVAALRRAFDVDRNAPAVASALIRLLTLLNDDERLERFLEGAQARGADAQQIAVARARLHARRGRFEEALRTFRSIGNSADTIADQARVLRMSGQAEAAIALLRGVTRPGRLRIAARIEIARCHADRGRAGDARAELEPFAAGALDHRLARHQILGSIAFENGDHAAARAHFEALTDADPAHPSAQSALLKLSVLDLDLDAARDRVELLKRSQFSTRLLRRASPNLVQGQAGAIVNELRVEPALLAGLAALRAHHDASREAELARHVIANPGFLAPAMQYVDLVLAAGAETPGPEAEGSGPPPRRIIQYWHEEPPPAVAAMMASWRSLEGFDYALFDQGAARDFIRGRFNPDYAKAFRLAPNHACRSDLFRLCALHELGGLYADADDIRTGPVDPAFDSGVEAVLFLEGWGVAGNNFIAARPGHPLVALAAEWARDSILAGDNDSTWSITGPGLMTRALARYCADPALNGGRGRRGIRLLTYGELRRMVAPHRGLPHKQTPGHWSAIGGGGVRRNLAWLMEYIDKGLS